MDHSPANTVSSSHSHEIGAPSSAADQHEPKHRILSIVQDAKQATKEKLHLETSAERVERSGDMAPHAIDNNAGFNPSKVLDVEASTMQRIKSKVPVPHSPKDLLHIVRHPMSTMRGKAAEDLAVSQNPHLSRDDDDRLVDAHDHLHALETSEAPEFDVDERIGKAQGRIDALEDERQQKRTAWTSSRYVHCLRTVSHADYTFPMLSSCRWIDESGEPQGARWSQWVGQLATLVQRLRAPPPDDLARGNDIGDEQPDWDQDALLKEVERIVVASTSIQRWASDLRRMRQWQDLRLTGAWFALWLIVWGCDRIFLFLYCYIAFQVLRTKTPFDRRQSMKEARVRATSDDEASRTLGEVVSRHGSSDWLQPTLDMVGPKLEPMSKIIADRLESMNNFTEYKTRRATTFVSLTVGGLILLSFFASRELCLRSLTLLMVLLFFLGDPISRRYPMYGRVLVPLHWILWDVPTNTELSFKYLRQRAQEIQRASVDQQASAMLDEGSSEGGDTNPVSGTAAVDLFATKAVWIKTSGSIILTFHDIRFVRGASQREVWRRRFDDVVEMSKGDGTTSLMQRTAHCVEFEFRDGSVEKFEQVKKRDELFNIVFAFSRRCWRQK